MLFTECKKLRLRLKKAEHDRDDALTLLANVVRDCQREIELGGKVPTNFETNPADRERRRAEAAEAERDELRVDLDYWMGRMGGGGAFSHWKAKAKAAAARAAEYEAALQYIADTAIASNQVTDDEWALGVIQRLSDVGISPSKKEEGA